MVIAHSSPGGSDSVEVATSIREPTTTAATTDGRPAGPVLMPRVHAELSPDGSIEPLPLARPGDTPMSQAVRLPDGRLVTLASRDLMPGVERQDGALVEGVAFVLAVFDGDGRLLGEHDIRRIGEQVSIAGERDGQVVLVRTTAAGNCCDMQRGVRASTIDPTSFEEHALASLDMRPGVSAVAGDRMVLAEDGLPGDTSCSITVPDLSTTDRWQVAALPCLGFSAVSLSPTGQRAAVALSGWPDITGGTDEPPDILDRAVVFVDLADGTMLDSEHFDIALACIPGRDPDCARLRAPVEYRGLLWVDDDTVELIVQYPDPDANPGAIDVGRLMPEQIRTITVDIG